MGFRERVQFLVDAIGYKPGYRLRLAQDQKDGQRFYLQVECDRLDSITKEMGVGRGGKGYLSEHMTNSEIVQLAFGLFRAYEEHECREFFTYRDKRVYGPHIDVEALMEVADRTSARTPSPVSAAKPLLHRIFDNPANFRSTGPLEVTGEIAITEDDLSEANRLLQYGIGRKTYTNGDWHPSRWSVTNVEMATSYGVNADPPRIKVTLSAPDLMYH